MDAKTLAELPSKRFGVSIPKEEIAVGFASGR